MKHDEWGSWADPRSWYAFLKTVTADEWGWMIAITLCMILGAVLISLGAR